MPERKETISDLFKEFASLKHILSKEAANFSPFVPPAQKEVLFMLKQQDGMTPKELAENLGITPGAATQLTEALVKMGLIIRKTDETDRRIAHMHLSPDGQKLVKKLIKVRTQLSHKLFDGLTASEITAFHNLIKKMKSNLENPKNNKD